MTGVFVILCVVFLFLIILPPFLIGQTFFFFVIRVFLSSISLHSNAPWSNTPFSIPFSFLPPFFSLTTVKAFVCDSHPQLTEACILSLLITERCLLCHHHVRKKRRSGKTKSEKGNSRRLKQRHVLTGAVLSCFHKERETHCHKSGHGVLQACSKLKKKKKRPVFSFFPQKWNTGGQTSGFACWFMISALICSSLPPVGGEVALHITRIWFGPN